MQGDAGRQIVRGFWATGLGTLASRVLGLVRDMVTAALLGLGSGGVMDAFVVAFRVPNLFRRVFGEGALAASMLPVFAAEHDRDPQAAWRLVSVLLAAVAAGMTALVLLGEAACALAWWLADPSGREALLLGLTATLLPYMVLICLAAQVSAVLQGLLRFRMPAVAPVLLNVCWLAAAWFVAPRFAGDPAAQAYVIAAAVVLSGALQLAVLWPALRRAGFQFDFDGWAAAGAAPGWPHDVAGHLGAGRDADQYAGRQLHRDRPGRFSRRAADDRLAGGRGSLSARNRRGRGHLLRRTVLPTPRRRAGAGHRHGHLSAAARHAARGDRRQIGTDLSLGLRLVWFTALPAGVGIMLVAEPVAQLLFVRGAFTAADAQRAAAMIACYASAAWAYCALPVLVRGFYATGDRTTPTRVGLVAVGVNLLVTFSLLWPIGERALALSTATAATVQVVVLTAIFSRARSALDWPELRATMAKGIAATAVMALVVLIVANLWPPSAASRGQQAAHLTMLVAAGGVAYLAGARLLGMKELAALVPRPAWPARSMTS